MYGKAKGLAGGLSICLVEAPRFVLVEVPVSFACQLDDLFQTLFQSKVSEPVIHLLEARAK